MGNLINESPETSPQVILCTCQPRLHLVERANQLQRVLQPIVLRIHVLRQSVKPNQARPAAADAVTATLLLFLICQRTGLSCTTHVALRLLYKFQRVTEELHAPVDGVRCFVGPAAGPQLQQGLI